MDDISDDLKTVGEISSKVPQKKKVMDNEYKDVVEFPAFGSIVFNPFNSPRFFARWKKGEIKELRNIPSCHCMKVVYYSDSQDPKLLPNRCVIIYKDHSMLLLTHKYMEGGTMSRIATYDSKEIVNQENTTIDEVIELKV